MNKNTLIIIFVIAVILVGGYIIYKPSYTAPTSTTTPTQQATGETKTVTVEGMEFSFTPSSVSVNKGDIVKITFKNVGSTSHNFGISELGIRSRTISGGASDTLEFVADKTGTFDFDCSIPGHRANGMLGSLNVA